MALPRHPKYTSDDLWDRYFMVRFQYLHARTVESIRRYGVRISDNPDFGQDRENEWVTTQLNIDSIFEKFRRGITIKVVNYDDTATIYNIIHTHILACAEALANNINVGNLPLKDVIELDEFASKIYDKAKGVFNEQERVSAISTNFLDQGSFNFFNILKRSASSQTEADFTSRARVKDPDAPITINGSKEPDKTPSGRFSYKDIFANDLARIEGWKGKL